VEKNSLRRIYFYRAQNPVEILTGRPAPLTYTRRWSNTRHARW